MTALQISVELGNKEIVELLLSCKDIDSRMKDKVSIHFSMQL